MNIIKFSSPIMRTFNFSLVLRTRENIEVFITLDENIYGIHNKRVNILYIFTISILGKNFGRQHFEIFSQKSDLDISCKQSAYFSQKTGLDISCKLSPFVSNIKAYFLIGLEISCKLSLKYFPQKKGNVKAFFL